MRPETTAGRSTTLLNPNDENLWLGTPDFAPLRMTAQMERKALYGQQGCCVGLTAGSKRKAWHLLLEATLSMMRIHCASRIKGRPQPLPHLPAEP